MAHNDNRTHNVCISLSDEEFEKLEQTVRESGMKKTRFCRLKLLSDSSSPERKEGENAVEVRSRMKEYSTIFMPIGRNLNSAYMAMKENGFNPKTIAKMEFALDEFCKITEEYFGKK